MATEPSPTASEVARETLKELARRRLVPTPECYAAVYGELSGAPVRAEDTGPWREMLAGTLEFLAGVDADGQPDPEAAAVAARSRAARSEAEVRALLGQVKRLWARWDLKASDRAEVARALQALLRLLAENVGELVADDQWMVEQSHAVIALLDRPATRASLRATERALRGVIYRQGARRHTLDQARGAFKEMVAVFAHTLESMCRSTGHFHERVAENCRRMEDARDLDEVRRAVDALLVDARAIQADVLDGNARLREARQRASEHERRVRDLEVELENAAALAREDVLTGTLNRRGFEEAWAVEAARARRAGVPLTLALLDVDHFKMVNDTFGHAAGDRALGHLAEVVRETLRPVDVVARFGGEEFVILLPGTDARHAAEVILRVQRALTRRFFLAGEEKVFITFSAGVAGLAAGEERESILGRADAALLTAKRAGRNRVVVAAPAPPPSGCAAEGR